MTLSVVYISFGLILLYFGAEWLVKGACSLAIRLGMTPMVAGLTVVAFGTSSPELVVSFTACLNGSGDIAIGNAVGSNIFNVACILGLTAVIIPMRVQFQLLKFDAPFMVLASTIFLWFFRDHTISWIEGSDLLFLLLAYLGLNVYFAKNQKSVVVSGEFAEQLDSLATEVKESPWRSLLFIIIGLAFLIIGSRCFVTGAVEIARGMGVSEAVIGLTIVAAGTSLPELASSLVAAYRKQADIAIGNVIGSNIFNILGIVGISGMCAGPIVAPGISTVDLGVMMALSALLIPIVWTNMQVQRWEGALLLCCYLGYLAYVWPK